MALLRHPNLPPTISATPRTLWSLSLLGMLACGPAGSDATTVGFTGASTDTGSGTTAASNAPTSSEATRGDGTETAGGQTETGTFEPRFDVENQSDDSGNTSGCRGIDFLFVIDNSGSMEDEQRNLINSVPGFIATIQATVSAGAQDFHVMVTDSDAGEFCVQLCDQNFLMCNQTACGEWLAYNACDQALGSGRVYDRGRQDCGIVGGQRYITSSQPDVGATFACTGDVGITGEGTERVAAAMTAAVDSGQVGPGGCNEGFLRDDAILVVTFITDEEEAGSPGDPPDWYADLLAAKGGNANAIVVLGLFGDTDQPAAICAPQDQNESTGAAPAPRLREFVGLFGGQGSWASVCAADYSPFFQASVDLVDTTCSEFEPAG